MAMKERSLLFQVLAVEGSDVFVGEVSDDVWQTRQHKGVCYGLTSVVLSNMRWTQLIYILGTDLSYLDI